jgi:osmotically-inducible protein OsmY
MTTCIADRAGQVQLARATILAAERRLKRSPFRELRLVFCTFDDGVLTLSGRVSSSFLRTLASTFVQNVENVRAVANHLVVKPPGGRYRTHRRPVAFSRN